MNNNKPNIAFILAAGQGTRLRPHTNDKPKPMVEVGGIPLIHHILKKLALVPVQETIINLFYLGDRIKHSLVEYNDTQIIFSEEEELLDTGGGVKKALSLIKGQDFYLINGDAFWIDHPDINTLDDLAQNWNPEKMDILLLLQKTSTMTFTDPVGDYDINETGRAIRNHDKNGQYMFTGVRINQSSLFANTPTNAFSYLQIMDKAQQDGRLYGLEHKGEWHHISTPNDLDRVNQHLQNIKAA